MFCGCTTEYISPWFMARRRHPLTQNRPKILLFSCRLSHPYFFRVRGKEKETVFSTSSNGTEYLKQGSLKTWKALEESACCLHVQHQMQTLGLDTGLLSEMGIHLQSLKQSKIKHENPTLGRKWATDKEKLFSKSYTSIFFKMRETP